LFRYYTSRGNSRIIVLSEWFTDCDIIILARINGLPNSFQYDYKIGWISKKEWFVKMMFVLVYKNGSCLIEIDQVSAFIWIYFQISVNNLTCLNNPIYGSMIIYSTG